MVHIRLFHLSFLPSVLRHALLSIAELPLAFLGFVICDDIGKNATGDCFNGVLRNTGIVHGFLFATHKFLIPPGSIKFSRYSWIYAYGRGSMAGLLSGVRLFDTGTDLCPFYPVMQVYKTFRTI